MNHYWLDINRLEQQIFDRIEGVQRQSNRFYCACGKDFESISDLQHHVEDMDSVYQEYRKHSPKRPAYPYEEEYDKAREKNSPETVQTSPVSSNIRTPTGIYEQKD